jgi:hypothetical protein
MGDRELREENSWASAVSLTMMTDLLQSHNSNPRNRVKGSTSRGLLRKMASPHAVSSVYSDRTQSRRRKLRSIDLEMTDDEKTHSKGNGNRKR